MIGFKLRHLSKEFAHKPVLQDLNIDIERGSFNSIIGPSGCGKSTLLRLLAGLEKPSHGSIEAFAPSLSKSFVFQEANLLPWRTSFENILLPLELQKNNWSSSEKKERVHEMLSLVQMENARLLYPSQLSGGMKMRIALARALITEPELILLDEPFSSLDEPTRHDLQIRLHQLWQLKGMTVIFVTHSMSEAVFLSQRVIGLKQGRVAMDQAMTWTGPRHPNLRNEESFHRQVQKMTEDFYA